MDRRAFHTFLPIAFQQYNPMCGQRWLVTLFFALLITTGTALAQNVAPVTIEDLYIVEENQTLTIDKTSGLLSNDYDPDGDSFSIQNGTSPKNGTLVLSGSTGGFTYTPNEDFTGTDTFGYRTRDTAGNTSSLTTVTIEVLPSPNRPPVAVTDGYTTPFETPLVVSSADRLLKNDYDPDGDVILVGVFDVSDLNGTLSNTNISTGTFTYTPPDGFSGIDSFRYLVRDPDFAAGTFVEVFIDVQAPTNRTPEAFPDFYGTPVKTPLVVPAAAGLLKNDYDPDGDAILVGVFDVGSLQGTLSNTNISTGSFTYTPPDGFSGIDSFRYLVRDPDFAAGTFVDVLIAVGVDVPLPVELVRFEAVRDGDVVYTTWETASETNNAGFEVQRAIDGGTFETLGFVDGHGTTQETKTYTYTDTELPFDGGGLTYRLKQIDYDGTFAYSPLVELDLRLPEAFALHENFPNPFSATTTIRYELPRSSHVRLAVYDVQGREVAVLVEGAQEAGRKAVPFDASGLASGVYLYRLETDRGLRQTGRMVYVRP